jgi:lipopolysaccharide/colanic/teichoic acid biosynthesis glycosyltransferase
MTTWAEEPAWTEDPAMGWVALPPRAEVYRRALDLVVGGALLVVVLPIMLLAIVGSAVSLRAWPFFVQERVGRNGQAFRFVKVRTLPPDTPGYIDKHQLDHSRVPFFCQLLRTLHLDELPQLLLVLRGQMSLVGPRPEMDHLHRLLPPAFAQLRTSARPGCTGLWQISEACSDLIGASPEYDRYYLAHRTLRLDLWVLYRTALDMAGIGREVTLDDVPSWTLRPGAATDIGTTTDVIDLRDHTTSVAWQDLDGVSLHRRSSRRRGATRLRTPVS